MPSNSNLTLAISLSGLFFLFFIAPTAVILLWHLPTRLARQNAALKTLAKQEGAWAAQKAVEKEVWASYCGGCQAEHDIKNMAEVVTAKEMKNVDIEMMGSASEGRAPVRVMYVQGCADKKGMSWEGEGIYMIREGYQSLRGWMVKRNEEKAKKKIEKEVEKEVEKAKKLAIEAFESVAKLDMPPRAYLGPVARQWGMLPAKAA